MHNIHNESEDKSIILHRAARYDFHTGLLGLGVNGSNSKMVIKMANLKPGDHVLDVGCGSGSLTLTAQASVGPNGKVYGIDASPEMIEVAKNKASRAGADVVFQLGLIQKLDFPDASFDVVISRLAIHHLPDDLKRKGFAEILRVLKPGGHLFVADFIPPANPVLNHIMSALVGSHMMHTDASSLPPLLKDAGFTDVASGPTHSFFLAFVSGKKQ